MGIANIINTAGGGGGGGSEIITNLVNSVDGAGLRLANQGYISCADVSANRFGTNDFSVEFVLSQETSAINADIFISNLNGSNQAVDAAVIRWDVVQNDNIQLVFTNSGATETAYNFGYDPAPDLNEPTHYLVSADRSGNAVLYRNGAEIASVSIAASGSANVGNSGQPTVIGSPVNNFGAKGNVYRLRTYSKALSSDEAKNVFDRADVPTALVSNLLLDLDCAYANPTQSTVIQDRGPNNQDGTLNGTITQTNVIKQLNSVSARIGTTQATPADGTVHIGDSTTTPLAGADDLIIARGSNDAGVTIRTATSSTGQICFADGNTGNEAYRGFIGYAHGTDKLNLGSGGETRMSIDSSGSVGITGDTDTSTFFGKTLAIADAGNCGIIFKKTTGTAKDYSVGVKSDGTFNVVDGSTPRLTIGTSGGVGINTAPDAAAQLDVNGTIYVRNTSVKGVISNPSGDIFDIANASGGTSNPITFSTQGSERMRIASTGHVAMTSDDSDAQLTLTGTGTGAAAKLNFVPQLNGNARIQVGGSDKLTISSTGLCSFTGGIAFNQTNSTVGGSITSTLSHYEQGTFTPTDASTDMLTFTSVACNYTRIGRVVILTGSFVYPTTSGSAQARVTPGTLPFPATGNTAGTMTIATVGGGGGIDTSGYIRKEDNGVFTNANLSGATIYFNTTYIV